MITAYTAACGPSFDIRQQPSYESTRYLAYTDRGQANAKPWEHEPLALFSEDPRADRLNAKVPKVLTPPKGISLWMDSYITLTQDPKDLAKEYLHKADIAVFKHPDRDSCYTEAATCSGAKKDDPDLLEAQVAYYKEKKMPADRGGLYYCGFILRRNTAAMRALSLAWWEQIQWFSSRDQISFPYVLWRLGIKPAVIPGCCFSSPIMRASW